MQRSMLKFSPWSSPLFIRDAYKKALKVIDSCVNETHLKGASNYLHNFLRLQSDDLGNGNFETDEYILNTYKRLKLKLDYKIIQLKDE